MKKIYLSFFSIIIAACAVAQVKYDDGPIIPGSSFVINGSWGRSNITYSFQNGTADIPNNDEQNAIRQAFQIWADYGNLNFTEVTSNADIVILWGTGNHGDGFPFAGVNGVLAHAFFPPPDGGTFSGDIHFDDDETWTLAAQATGNQPIDLVTVAAHEIGHALGLGHSDVACALMNPFYTGSHRYLAPDDIEGIQSIYGNRTVIRNITSNCSGGTYFINNLPVGANVVWTSSNNLIATVVNSNNQGIVSWTGNQAGEVRITAAITLPCGIDVIEFFDMNYGIPYIDLVTFSNGANEEQYFCTSHYGNQFQPFFSFTPENSSIEYRVLSWPSLNLVYTDPNAYPLGVPIPMNYMSTPGSYVVVEVKLTTPCGSTAWMGFEVEYVDCSETGGGCPSCEFRLSASPNPTDGDLNVTIENEKPEVKALNKNEKVRYVLYDVNRAQMVKQWMFDNGQNRRTLNVRGIKAGQYILVVTKGKYRQSTQIIIK